MRGLEFVFWVLAIGLFVWLALVDYLRDEEDKMNGATRVRVYTVPGVADEAAEVALRMFGGYTLFETVGGWRDPDTTTDYVEAGKVLEILVADWARDFVKGFLNTVDVIAAAHGETCVMVTRDRVKHQLRYGDEQ